MKALLANILETYRDEMELPEDAELDVDTADEFGVTPLHAAARLGEADHLRVMLACGADVNARGEEGATPLHDAAGYGWEEAVKLLLDQGADPTLKDEDGATPSQIARQMEKPEIAEIIEAHRATA